MTNKQFDRISTHMKCMECIYTINELKEVIDKINLQIYAIEEVEHEQYRCGFIKALGEMLNANQIKMEDEQRKYDTYLDQLRPSLFSKIINKLTNYTY
jgi:hypothetical protein